MSVYDVLVKEIYQKIKGDKDAVINGQNKNIETYYQIWKGVPSWLKYTVWANGKPFEQKMMTFNLPRQISRAWANNYANEGINIGLQNQRSTDGVNAVLNDNHFYGNFNKFTESFMGIGSGAIVVNADSFNFNEKTKELLVNPNAKVKVTFVNGRRVVPITVVDGLVVECAFVIEETRKTRFVLHLLDEKYNYNIYEVTGVKTTASDTKLSLDFDNMVHIQAGAVPLFTFWHPNITDDDDIDTGTGTSIFSMALDSFQMCDLIFTAFWKEVKYGQKVKVVSADLQPVSVDENGNAVKGKPFDPNDESVIILPNGTDAKAMVQELNGELRVPALVQSLNTYINLAGMLCGLGSTSFEFDGQSGRPIQTATGIIAKQTELYRNVVKQENFARDNLIVMIQAIAWVNNNWTKNPKINADNPNKINITFDDNIIEDTQTKKDNALKEVQAGLLSKQEYRADFYEEDEETALKYLQDNGLLVNDYLPALQSGAMTPEQYVDYVFGKDVQNKQAIIDYITNQLSNGNNVEVENYNNE